MLAQELVSRILAVIEATKPDGYLPAVLEDIALEYTKLKEAWLESALNNNPERACPSSDTLHELLNSFKTRIKTRQLNAAVATLADILTRNTFVFPDKSHDAPSIINNGLEAFASAYEQYIHSQMPASTLLMMSKASALHYDITLLRTALRGVQDALAPVAVEVPDGWKRLTISFDGQVSYDRIVEILAALNDIYRELCILLDVGDLFPLDVLQIQSGSLLLDVMGATVAIEFLDTLLDRAIDFVHGHWTIHGKLTKSTDAILAALKIRDALEKAGLSTDKLDGTIEKAVAMTAEKLVIFIGGEAELTVNGRKFSYVESVRSLLASPKRVGSAVSNQPLRLAPPSNDKD